MPRSPPYEWLCYVARHCFRNKTIFKKTRSFTTSTVNLNTPQNKPMKSFVPLKNTIKLESTAKRCSTHNERRLA